MLIAQRPEQWKYWKKLSDPFTPWETLEIYNAIPREKQHYFWGTILESEVVKDFKQYVKLYPNNFFSSEWMKLTHNEQEYGRLNEPYQEVIEREWIDKYLYPKLQDRYLLDLGCGYRVYPLYLLALKSRAKYLGIDGAVRRSLKEWREFQQEKCSLLSTEDLQNLKLIRWNFNDFLQYIPETPSWWINFTFNALEYMRESQQKLLKENIQKHRKPWNVIIAIDVHNISITSLIWDIPHCLDMIIDTDSVMWDNTIHVYKRLHDEDAGSDYITCHYFRSRSEPLFYKLDSDDNDKFSNEQNYLKQNKLWWV